MPRNCLYKYNDPAGLILANRDIQDKGGVFVKCVKCGSENTVEGRVFNQPDYVSPQAFFRPRELKPFALFGIHIRIKKNKFCSCIDCGCLWTRIDSGALKKVIKNKGNKSVKQRLGLEKADI